MTRALNWQGMALPHWAVLLLMAQLSAAPLDLSAWKFRKRIPVTAGDGLAVVKLDREVYIGAQLDLSDLRVIRDGAEVPYELKIDAANDDGVEARQKLFDMAVVKGPGVQFSMKAGRAPHNTIRLSTNEHNFRERVRIEASADNLHWALLRNDGAIFDFTHDGNNFQALDVPFPVSTKPFLRVTVFGWDKLAAVQSVSVNYQRHREAALEMLGTIVPEISEDAHDRSTDATIDLGTEGLPADCLLIESSSSQFQRAVELLGSNNGKDWSHLSQGVIARLPGDGFTEQNLIVDLPGDTRNRFFRIRIYNRDDQPIRIDRIRVYGRIRHVRFLPLTPGTYWLYYGNSKAHAPGYDLAAVLARRGPIAETSWTLGPAEANPARRAPKKPWSEQHPAILYTVLGVVIVALGSSTLRFAARLR